MSFTFRHVEVTASTNDDVKLLAEAGATEGLILSAGSQTSGRGRQGRVWQSPVGNLYCSILLRPKANQNLGLYSFVAALAIYDLVRECLAEKSIELKWPNDVLVEGKKISGILIEAGDGYLVIGIGLNVKHLPENPLYPATSLAEQGADIDVAGLPQKLMPKLWYWYEVLQNEGFEMIRTAWLTHALKGEMTARLPEVITGQFVTIDQNGRLILRLADGVERAIATGDVFFVP